MLVPKILGALLVFGCGWLLASFVGKLVAKVLGKLRFDEMFKKAGWAKAFKEAEFKTDASNFVGMAVKWILVFVFLLAAVEILGFLQFAVFLREVLSFVPNVIVSVLIFVVAVVLSDILQKLVVASVEKARIEYAKFAGMLVKWSILAFAILAILVQLGIARQLALTLFSGLVGMLALAFGLSFGLGGKDIAAEILRELKNKLR